MSANSTFSNGKSKSAPYLYWNEKLFFYLTGDMDMRFASLVLSACVLTACGGGGGSASDPGGVPTLSATQAAFESFGLSPNVSYSSSSILPYTGAVSASDYYYDNAFTLAKSPLTGTQRVTRAAPVNLTKTLTLPPPPYASWYFADGAFYRANYPSASDISYVGSEVVSTTLSEDLKHTLYAIALTQITVTALTGLMVTEAGRATGVLSDAIYSNTELTTKGAAWVTGSAYITSAFRYTTDLYYVSADFTGTPTKASFAPAPIASSTSIDALIGKNLLTASTGAKVYGANDGAVSNPVPGVKVYTAKAPESSSPGQAPQYRAFYEMPDGNVYSGYQIKAGAVSTSSGGYNAQARASIQAALKF